MSVPHCPLCNTKEIFALGAVEYSQGVMIEHRCKHCGHIFCLGDRRANQANTEINQSPTIDEEVIADSPLVRRA